MTAYHSLIQLANLQKNQTILVHGANKHVGQATLKIAQHIGATTFATISSSTERSDITRTIDLPPAQILSSEAQSF